LRGLFERIHAPTGPRMTRYSQHITATVFATMIPKRAQRKETGITVVFHGFPIGWGQGSRTPGIDIEPSQLMWKMQESQEGVRVIWSWITMKTTRRATKYLL
jgi:hypothetical protein